MRRVSPFQYYSPLLLSYAALRASLSTKPISSEPVIAQTPIKPIAVAITGASGSGKTTLVKALADHYQKAGLDVSIVHLDWYYKGRAPELGITEFLKQNFDHPSALNFERFMADLKKLLQGESITAPCVDYEKGTFLRIEEAHPVKPARLILVEGTLVCLPEEDLYRLRVYAKAPSGICLARRAERDKTERKLDYEHTLAAFKKTVFPMYQQFIKRGIKEALVVNTYRADGSDPLPDNLRTITREIDQLLAKQAEAEDRTTPSNLQMK